MSNATKSRKTAKPKIVIGAEDHERLTQLANGLIDRRPDLADGLFDELERARLVQNGTVPAGTVQMGSSIEFQSDDGDPRRVSLVYPGDADIAEGRISILTPIGTALLGLSIGQTIDFVANNGRSHKLTVLAVDAAPASPA